MISNQLFIPNKIKIGFVSREDTYTKKLAYVIYWDLTGKLRKETSWNSWRDETIEPKDFDNIPTEGFVLNKGVGGQRHSYGWNARNEYIRVYDPRDFEFEISVANLLFILRECDCSRGKGLEGKFVYAWEGKELVLLPEISQDYQKSKDFTKLQNLGVRAKELIKGATYETKNQTTLIYLGKFDYYYVSKSYGSKKEKSGQPYKRFVFWEDCFVFLDSLKSLARLKSDNIIPNYAELVDKYYKSQHGSKIVSLFTKPYQTNPKHNYRDNSWVYQEGSDYFQCFTTYKYNSSEINYVSEEYKISLENGIINVKYSSHTYHPDGTKTRNSVWPYKEITRPSKWVEPTNQKLYAKLENGSEFEVDGYYGLK